MKKYRLEIILFIVNAVYMILELVASRVLAPYFGTSNLIWTSIIGIILLSTSIGNYIGGTIADRTQGDNEKLNQIIKMILIISGILILLIPLSQQNIIDIITKITKDIRVGAIITTLMLFFIPSMFIGMISPVVIKFKMNVLDNVGKVSGKISALATLGSIIGTFFGGFVLIPSFGSNEILFVLSIIMFIMIFITDDKFSLNKFVIFSIICIVLDSVCFIVYIQMNKENSKKVLMGQLNVATNLDTQYGKVVISNYKLGDKNCRLLNIDKGHESATYIDENYEYELVFDYAKFYDLMYKSSNEIKNTLMIGGAGYSYPKYFISQNLNKNMDVVEIDGDITEIAKKYFFLDKLIDEFNLNENKRLNIYTEDGRIFLNNNTKKYDAILNDAFSGNSPAKTLTTIEAVEKIHNSLNNNGIYLTNIISALDGEESKFIKAEVKTLKQVFKNVYIIPCLDKEDLLWAQNNMVIATDEDIYFEESVNINYENAIILTDNYCPVDSMIHIF